MQLSNFRVIGNKQSGDGVVAVRVNEIFIDGVTCSYHGRHGVLLDHCYEDPRVVNSLFTYNVATGVAIDGCHDIVVSANQFEENQDALTCIDAFNLCMTGNNVDDHLRHDKLEFENRGLLGGAVRNPQRNRELRLRPSPGIVLDGVESARQLNCGTRISNLQDASQLSIVWRSFGARLSLPSTSRSSYDEREQGE